uniref:EF-hand domain-containing protein n=1 Tax=Solanum lycopersicum TaxID=4081 RepID=K4D1H7_SOLLC
MHLISFNGSIGDISFGHLNINIYVRLIPTCTIFSDNYLTIILGKQWRETQIHKITDNVFDRVRIDSGRENLKFEDLYIAVLLVFNDINKRLPGPHFDPPTKHQVRVLMQECDINTDGELDRQEFVKFIRKLTKDTFIMVSQGQLITLAVAPTIAVLTKRSTEGVPHVGMVVQKMPSSVYASLVTLAVVLFQQAVESKE